MECCRKLIFALLMDIFLNSLAEITTNSKVEFRWDFSDCEKVGRRGPYQEECDEAYRGTNLDGDVTLTQGIQRWRAPMSGLYLITARGPSGLNVGNREGGRGAVISGHFRLEVGQSLNILIGQRSDYNSEFSALRGPGGSGGTYVTRLLDGFVLMVAGGGSTGAGDVNGLTVHREADANLNENGKNASSVEGSYGLGGVSGFGGFRGVVSLEQISSSGGGAGYYGDGNSSYVKSEEFEDLEFPKPAVRFVSKQFSDRAAGMGGYFMFRVNSAVQENNGGFGGGGSGSSDGGAGGGGGYSGGGGGALNGWGGGAGSINNAEAPMLSSLHKGSGSVSISFIGLPCCGPGPVAVYVAASFVAGIVFTVAMLFCLFKFITHFKTKKN